MNVQLIVPAAGTGARLGCSGPKALVDLAGTPILVRTLRRFSSLGLTDGAVIIHPPGHAQAFQSALAQSFPDTGFTLVAGGAERQLSVRNGLAALNPNTEVVAIHDAARPFVSADSVRAAIDAAARDGAATVAVPSVDTVLQADAEGYLQDTPDRRFLWACQTPQVFRVEVIAEAHACARREGHIGTDDASLVRRMGGKVKLVEGTPLNFKITTPADLALATQVVRGGLA